MFLTNSKIPILLLSVDLSLSPKPSSANLSLNISIMKGERKEIQKLLMLMAPYTLENGKTFFLMEKEKCIFQMARFTQDSSQKVLLRAKEDW